MGIKDNIAKFTSELERSGAKLIAVSKTHPVDKIREAYAAGQRIFGENKVQEMTEKAPQLPGDIQWHLIGHLQRNKVRYIAPFVSLIHSVDSQKLLHEIDQQGKKNGKVLRCLLQVFIAKEATKFGLTRDELLQLIQSPETAAMTHISIEGLMGMATLTENKNQIREEFDSLKKIFDDLKTQSLPGNIHMKELSMGMSSDYQIALGAGSTMVRIGTSIFGTRENT